jgi:DNA ligase (NAD+)
MDIPMIGRMASRELDRHFKGDLDALESAALGGFDFTALYDFGDIMDRNIRDWFSDTDNLDLYHNLQKEMKFEERKEETAMKETKDNIFEGRTIVATGKLEHFTRDSINSAIVGLGATAGSSVTKNTDYPICGEKAGSKLAKAQELGVTVLTEQEFLDMLSA